MHYLHLVVEYILEGSGIMRLRKHNNISDKTIYFEEMHEEVLHTLQDGGIGDISQEYMDLIGDEIVKPQKKHKKK